MSKNNANITSIMQDLHDLYGEKILTSREERFKNFITETVNGDVIQQHLVIDLKSDADNREAVVYILTNLRLINIDIDSTVIKSNSFSFDAIVTVERKLIDENQAEVRIVLQNDSFGLRYPNDEQKITDFFQMVDKIRIQRGTRSA